MWDVPGYLTPVIVRIKPVKPGRLGFCTDGRVFTPMGVGADCKEGSYEMEE